MKKLLIAVFLILFSQQLHAAGPYDGIWSISDGSRSVLAVATENNGTLIMVALNPEYMEWSADWGYRNQNRVRLVTLVDAGIYEIIDVVFTTPTTLTMTQVSCQPTDPDYECLYPNGHTVYGTKVW